MSAASPAADATVAPLFVPADRPERFAKAAASGADAIIVDLEDAVAAAGKDAARANLEQAVGLPCPVIVRINGRATRWHDADLDAVRRLGFSALMLPKTESADDVRAVASDAASVIALVESASGVAAARAIAAVAARLAFGSIDYCADLGCQHTESALLTARAELVLASRLGHRPAPIDGVTRELADPERLRRETAHARELGFGGKLCIHPTQVATVLAGFSPSEEEVQWAMRVLATAAGAGAASVDGMMVDAPVRLMAERLLARRTSSGR